VTPEDLDKRAKELGVMSIETSAKAGHNVKALFKKIAMALPGGAEAKDAVLGELIRQRSTSARRERNRHRPLDVLVNQVWNIVYVIAM
jgi:hypothetical protein